MLVISQPITSCSIYTIMMTTYILAGGCFWCLDAVYRRLRGVNDVVSGYTGGQTNKPSYYDVMSGETGHAESAKIIFDETIIPSDIILDIFFLIHDPTSLNRQGADTGTQYRSAMFYDGDDQRADFVRARERAQKLWHEPIVTEITALTQFFEAESEHQNYYNRVPGNPYCTVVIDPKIAKAKTEYQQWFVA